MLIIERELKNTFMRAFNDDFEGMYTGDGIAMPLTLDSFHKQFSPFYSSNTSHMASLQNQFQAYANMVDDALARGQQQKLYLARYSLMQEYKKRFNIEIFTHPSGEQLLSAMVEIYLGYIEQKQRSLRAFEKIFDNFLVEAMLSLAAFPRRSLDRLAASYILEPAGISLNLQTPYAHYFIEDLLIELVKDVHSYSDAIKTLQTNIDLLQGEVARLKHTPNESEIKRLAKTLLNKEPDGLPRPSICIEYGSNDFSDRHRAKFDKLASVSVEGRSFSSMDLEHIRDMGLRRLAYFVGIRGWNISPVSQDLADYVNKFYRGEIVADLAQIDLDENDFLDNTLHWQGSYLDVSGEAIGGKAYARTIIVTNDAQTSASETLETKPDYFAILSNLKNSPFDKLQGPSIDEDIRSNKHPAILQKLEYAGIEVKKNAVYPGATEQIVEYIKEKEESGEISPVLKGFIDELIKNRRILLFERLFIDPASQEGSRNMLYKLTSLMASIAVYGFNNQYESWLIQCDNDFLNTLKDLFGEKSIERMATTVQVKNNAEGKPTKDECNTIVLNIREALKYRFKLERAIKNGDPFGFNITHLVLSSIQEPLKASLMLELDKELESVYPLGEA